MKPDKIAELNEICKNFTPKEVIEYFYNKISKNIALASSLSIEDQVLTDIILQVEKNIKIFTLDTGRLFPETYNLIDTTNKHYGININVFFPDFQDVQKMVNKNGVNLFYDSVEKRKLCCDIRKIYPLKRAYTGLTAWICGLRKEQSTTRESVKMIEWDKKNNLIKINPLIDWTTDQVWEYIRKFSVPYNHLQDKNFVSIGCMPCTRAIKEGENIRAGRWWWENPETKECGLHR